MRAAGWSIVAVCGYPQQNSQTQHEGFLVRSSAVAVAAVVVVVAGSV